MQSRNVVFTIAVASLAYYMIGRWRKSGKGWAVKLYLYLIIGISATVIAVVLFSGPMIDWVEGLGGTSEAAATVHARLEQYQFGWSLVKNRILLGTDPETYEKNELRIIFIHNMWLRELVQSGLMGVFAMLVFYYQSMKNQVARLSADRASIARVYIAVLISSLVATQFYPGDTPIFWVIMGLATALPQPQLRGNQPVELASPVSTRGSRVILARRHTTDAGG